MTTSRETARDALVALLETALVGVGLPVKTVSGSKVESLTGITPLVCVLSVGSEHAQMTFTGDQTTFHLLVQVWVLQSGEDWTLAQAEDALDTIESLIASVYELSDSTAVWDQLEISAPTKVSEWEVAGVPHYREDIPTVAKLVRS